MIILHKKHPTMFFKKISLKNFHFIILILAVVIYFITALNSLGYYHADEHYQIIEFAGKKLGTHTEKDLAWEYKANIRSAIQPMLCVMSFKILGLFNITNPYTKTFFLRMLSGLFTLLIINFFIRTTISNIHISYQRAYILLSYFLWFLPFLSVRFSSETWSGIMFLLSLALIQSKMRDTPRYIFTGLAFGLCFLFRFQTAILSLGLLAWLLLIKKENIITLIKIVLPGLFIVLLGVFIDYWFYEKPVLTFWNYIRVFLQNSNGDSDFGISPWYYYIYQIINLPTIFIGIPLLVSLIFIIYKKRLSIYLWCILPFIFIHSIIPHKEERFLFPIVFLFPVILISGYQELIILIKKNQIKNTLNILFAIIFMVVNIIGLTIMSQEPAGLGRMVITKYIHDNYKNQPVHLIYCPSANPYDPWECLPEKFYLEKNMKFSGIKTLWDYNENLLLPNYTNLIVIIKCDFEKSENKELLNHYRFILKKQSISPLIEKINKYYNGFDDRHVLFLYSYGGA